MSEQLKQKVLIAKKELEQAIKNNANVDAKRKVLEKAITELEHDKKAQETNTKLESVEKSVKMAAKSTNDTLITTADKLISQQKATEASVLGEIKQAVSQLIPVLEKLPEGFKIDIPETNIDGQSVVVSNIDQLEKILGEISKKINTAPEVKVENKQDLTYVNKTFDHIQKLLEKIHDKKTEVYINKEVEFPKDPKDAIPVVLVDSDRRKFYDAIMNVVSGGGPNIRKIESSLESIDAKTPPMDSAMIDAFGRSRVSEPFTIFDSKMVEDKKELFYSEITNGQATATFNPNDASVSLGVSADGDYSIRQTYMRFDYQPAKSQRIFLTGVIGSGVAGTETRFGYFNTATTAPYTAERDGLYFGVDTEAYVAISKNGVEKKIYQSDWNVDTLDGTGQSGITLNLDVVQIFTIDFEWLGVGRVRFGFVIDGLVYYCHYENHANVDGETGVYMSSPNHSVRYEIYSTGGAKEVKQICSSIQSEGGVDPTGITLGIDRGIDTVARDTTTGAVLLYRLKADRLTATVAAESFSTLCTSNNAANYRYSILINPTIAGTALTWISQPDSSIEYAIPVADNTVTGGVELLAGYSSGQTPSVTLPTRLVINPGVSVDGVRDIFCLAVQTTSQSDNFLAAINVRELAVG